MWIFTTVGFFSVVQKSGERNLTVRARVASDLDHLRKEFMRTLSPTVTGEGTDYPYRATINHQDFADGMAKVAKAIHYSNFKSEVGRKMGSRREEAYHKVWHILYNLEAGTEE